MIILITGTSGFIGYHTAKTLLDRGDQIIGYDNENDYYDISLKQERRQELEKYDNFTFYKGDLEDFEKLSQVFSNHNIQKVCHLAAQAGVRYSLENPRSYINANLIGFFNILELSKQYKLKNFVYASSSSVYGNNKKQPFSIDDRVDNPISLYAVTKKSNELIAHTYSHLYNLPTIGLRFFTVYGPSGRPDMAPFIFTKKILAGESIDVFNHGKSKRDFTYIDDIVSGVIKSLDHNGHNYEILNLGNDKPEELEYFISLIEKYTSKKANKIYKDLQPGDVPETWSDIEYTKKFLNWQPTTSLDKGLKKFVEWMKGRV